MRQNRSLAQGGFGREEEAIFGGTGRRDFEAGVGGGAGSGTGPEGRDFGTEVLPAEEALRWVGDRPGPAVEIIAGREPEAEAAV